MIEYLDTLGTIFGAIWSATPHILIGLLGCVSAVAVILLMILLTALYDGYVEWRDERVAFWILLALGFPLHLFVTLPLGIMWGVIR